MAGDPPTGAQYVTGDGEFVGWSADIAGGIMEDEVLEMNKFAIDPQRGAGIGELGAFEEARADGRTGYTLVETRQFDTGAECRLQQGCHADFREIVNH